MPDSEKNFPFSVIEGDGKKPRDTKSRDTKLRVIEGEKDKKIAGISRASDYEYHRSKAVIEEEKNLEIEEIIGVIKEIAKKEGFNDDYLEIVAEERNEDGDLLSLTVGLKYSKLNPKQRAKHLNKAIYHYIIKSNQYIFTVDKTAITKGYAGMDYDDFEFDKLPDDGKVLAEYNNGEWQYTLDKE